MYFPSSGLSHSRYEKRGHELCGDRPRDEHFHLLRGEVESVHCYIGDNVVGLERALANTVVYVSLLQWQRQQGNDGARVIEGRHVHGDRGY